MSDHSPMEALRQAREALTDLNSAVRRFVMTATQKAPHVPGASRTTSTQGDAAAAINIQPMTVEQASQALFDLTVMSQWENWIPARDALIAAVRAEEAK